MTFKLLPTIDMMIELYEKPRSVERFQEYLNVLQGATTGNLSVPISGFNPMAKEHVLVRLRELKSLDAERIIEEILNDLNGGRFLIGSDKHFSVAINLSDDLKGGWTNRFTSDYDSKFKFNGLFGRGFCTPIFWSSERFSKEIIRVRVIEYVFRSVYWLTSPRPRTLKEHLAQEIFVAGHAKSVSDFQESDFKEIEQFYRENEGTDNHHVIFNFFYGDKAAESLGFSTYGIINDVTGFDLAKKNKIL